MKDIQLKQLYRDTAAYADREVTVRGWIRTNRSSNKFGFVEINDGSFFKSVQVVYEDAIITNYEAIAKAPIAAALLVKGTLVLTPDAKQPFEIKAAEIVMEADSAPEAAGFQAEFHIPEEPVYAELDELEMGRALDNLIDNALRYNEAGTKLSLTLREIEAEGKKCAEILLEDDGRGIPRELSDGLFKPFAIRESGSGLGLSIVQKIIELHGGTIYLQTDSGKGCRFTIHLKVHSTI